MNCVRFGSLSGNIDGVSDIEDVGSWDVLSNSGLVVDGLSAWLFSLLGDSLFHNLFFLLGAFNIDGDVVVSEDSLWNSDTIGSLGNDWGGTDKTGVESTVAKTCSSVVATKSKSCTNEETMVGVI